ncbi:unnamed protein product [Linum trigynum]|uniref:Uncharacterized protein n=1 Tax=Linum trigynum TaxID=586398 RepID=A0AAV2CRY1_9ROSI
MSLTFSAKKQGLAEISRTFRACKNVQSVDSVLDWLWSAYVYTAMVKYPTEANFMIPLPAYPVEEVSRLYYLI